MGTVLRSYCMGHLGAQGLDWPDHVRAGGLSEELSTALPKPCYFHIVRRYRRVHVRRGGLDAGRVPLGLRKEPDLSNKNTAAACPAPRLLPQQTDNRGDRLHDHVQETPVESEVYRKNERLYAQHQHARQLSQTKQLRKVYSC